MKQMVRRYIRKTDRQNWLEEDMGLALRDVFDGKKSKNEASKAYNIPKSTFKARVRQVQSGCLTIEQACRKKLGCQKFLSDRQEKLLVDHIILLESRLFNVKRKDIRCLAYQITKTSSSKLSIFNKTNKMAGTHWLYNFFERHPVLPENRFKSTYTDSTSVDYDCLVKFFDITELLCKKYNITTSNIYCLDELGITALPNQISEVITNKTKIEIISQLDKPGVVVSSVCCSNAVGKFMPLSFVFPLMTEDVSLLEGLPEGSLAEFHINGRMQMEMFARWMQRFVNFSKPTCENPVLLLLDGTFRHAKSFEFVNLARQNNVHLLSFPLNSVEKIHPLSCFLDQVSACYEDEVAHWLEDNAGESITLREIAKLFGAAFTEAAVVKIAIEGFEKTGIVPLDRTVMLSNCMFKSPPSDIEGARALEQTPKLNQNDLLPDIAWYTPIPLFLSDDPLLPVDKQRKPIRKPPTVKSTVLSRWRRQIQKRLQDDIDVRNRSDEIQNPIVADDLRDTPLAISDGSLSQSDEVSDHEDNKWPFPQSELLKPEEVMIYDSCIKEEPMECEVDDEWVSNIGGDTCADILTRIKEEEDSEFVETFEDVSIHVKQEDEMSSNERLVELRNNISEDCNVSEERRYDFQPKSKFKCSDCDIEFLWKRDLTLHQMTYHKNYTEKKTSVVKGRNGQPIVVKHFDPGNLPVVQVGQNVSASKQVVTTSCTKNIARGDKVYTLSSKPRLLSINLSSKSECSGSTQRNPGQTVPPVKPSGPAELDGFFRSRPEDVDFFTVLSKSLGTFPEEKRQATKKKIMELVYNVATNKLDPSSVIFLTALNR